MGDADFRATLSRTMTHRAPPADDRLSEYLRIAGETIKTGAHAAWQAAMAGPKLMHDVVTGQVSVDSPEAARRSIGAAMPGVMPGVGGVGAGLGVIQKLETIAGKQAVGRTVSHPAQQQDPNEA